MDLATDHPDYDATAELLCLIPPYPHSVPISDVISDMGFKSDRVVTTLARQAQALGHDIRIQHKGRNRHISVVMDGPFTEAACMAYWKRVYGEVQA